MLADIKKSQLSPTAFDMALLPQRDSGHSRNERNNSYEKISILNDSAVSQEIIVEATPSHLSIFQNNNLRAKDSQTSVNQFSKSQLARRKPDVEDYKSSQQMSVRSLEKVGNDMVQKNLEFTSAIYGDQPMISEVLRIA